MSDQRIYLSPNQMQFFNSKSDYTLFCGGLGSGKTHAGAVWAISMALKYPNVKGLITANSYSQLKKATLSKIFQLLGEMGIKFRYRTNDGVLMIGDATIYCISMENYDYLRGIEAGWAWSDECAFYKEEAFSVLIGRIRDARGTCQWKGTTTPNGYNWLYSNFVERPLPNSEVVYGKTADNLGNLSSNYLDALKAQYDTRLARQELDGEFVNLTSGKVYYAFDRNTNVQEESDEHALVFVGLDFNVHPLCGIFCIQKGGKIYVTNELYLEDSNTFQAAKEILRRYPFQPVHVIPDETGNRRKSAAAQTDHEILRRANLNIVSFKNPGVKDRQNNVNRLLDHKKLFISPKCVRLVKDLEQLSHDNKDPMLGHITDALGYACWHLDPLKKERRPARVYYR